MLAVIVASPESGILKRTVGQMYFLFSAWLVRVTRTRAIDFLSPSNVMVRSSPPRRSDDGDALKLRAIDRFLGVDVGSGVRVGVRVGVAVRVGVLVGVIVRVGVDVLVTVGVRVGVAVGVDVGVGVGGMIIGSPIGVGVAVTSGKFPIQ